MQKRTLVSILINNYNYADYVGEAIGSALRQDYSPIEVVVVDDGSIDDSVDVIREYDDRIVTILQRNNGQGSAYNAGFAACHGEIVIFLDADDRLHPGAVSEIVKHFDDDVSKVQFGLNVIDSDGAPSGRPLISTFPDTEEFSALLRKVLSYPSPPGSGNAYSRKFLRCRLPLQPDRWRICADAALIFAAPIDGKIAQVRKCLGDYRRHGTGASDLTAGNLIAYIDKECDRLLYAREYTARLLEAARTDTDPGTYGFEPIHLKLLMAQAFLCHTEAPSWSLRRHFISEAVRTALSWTPWSTIKRCALPFWVLFVSLCPHRTGARILAASLMHGFPRSRPPNDRRIQTSLDEDTIACIQADTSSSD